MPFFGAKTVRYTLISLNHCCELLSKLYFSALRHFVISLYRYDVNLNVSSRLVTVNSFSIYLSICRP